MGFQSGTHGRQCYSNLGMAKQQGLTREALSFMNDLDPAALVPGSTALQGCALPCTQHSAVSGEG